MMIARAPQRRPQQRRQCADDARLVALACGRPRHRQPTARDRIVPGPRRRRVEPRGRIPRQAASRRGTSASRRRNACRPSAPTRRPRSARATDDRTGAGPAAARPTRWPPGSRHGSVACSKPRRAVPRHGAETRFPPTIAPPDGGAQSVSRPDRPAKRRESRESRHTPAVRVVAH